MHVLVFLLGISLCFGFHSNASQLKESHALNASMYDNDTTMHAPFNVKGAQTQATSTHLATHEEERAWSSLHDTFKPFWTTKVGQKLAEYIDKLMYKYAWWRSNPTKAFEHLRVVKTGGKFQESPEFRDWLLRVVKLRRQGFSFDDHAIMQLLQAHQSKAELIPLYAYIRTIPGMHTFAEQALVDMALNPATAKLVYKTWLEADEKPETIYWKLHLDKQVGNTNAFHQWLDYIQAYRAAGGTLSDVSLFRVLDKTWMQMDPTEAFKLLPFVNKEGILEPNRYFRAWLLHVVKLRNEGNGMTDHELIQLLKTKQSDEQLVPLYAYFRSVPGLENLGEEMLRDNPATMAAVTKLWPEARESPRTRFQKLQLRGEIANNPEFKEWFAYANAYSLLGRHAVNEAFSAHDVFRLVMSTKKMKEARFAEVLQSLRQAANTKPLAEDVLMLMASDPIISKAVYKQWEMRARDPMDFWQLLPPVFDGPSNVFVLWAKYYTDNRKLNDASMDFRLLLEKIMHRNGKVDETKPLDVARLIKPLQSLQHEVPETSRAITLMIGSAFFGPSTQELVRVYWADAHVAPEKVCEMVGLGYKLDPTLKYVNPLLRYVLKYKETHSSYDVRELAKILFTKYKKKKKGLLDRLSTIANSKSFPEMSVAQQLLNHKPTPKL